MVMTKADRSPFQLPGTEDAAHTQDKAPQQCSCPSTATKGTTSLSPPSPHLDTGNQQLSPSPAPRTQSWDPEGEQESSWLMSTKVVSPQTGAGGAGVERSGAVGRVRVVLDV